MNEIFLATEYRSAPTNWGMLPLCEAPHRIALGQASFPIRLAALAHPPRQLWFWGNRPPEPKAEAIAIVGSRAASGAGVTRAKALAHDLALAGHIIVSGGAFGIDAAAHEGALSAGGITWAVLGCGVDVIYPDRHAGLFARIRASGALLSEFPPGTPPRRRQFPARNRIIVGLSRAVIVVEAAPRSGALISARLARLTGRRLFAVPGTAGTDALLTDGQALAVSSADDVTEALAGRPVASETTVPSIIHSVARAPAHLVALLSAVASGAGTVARLSLVLGQSVSEVLALCAEAELEGLITRRQGIYEVMRGN